MTDTKLDLRELLRAMTAAMGAELKSLWKEVKDYAQLELKSFAEHLKLIQKLKLQGKINKKQASHYLQLKRSSLKIILLAVQGISLLSAENAINAALAAIRDVVNRIIGWKLL